MIHFNCPNTVQTLLLLCVHYFGAGETGNAWLTAGQLMRVAIDTALNRDTRPWKLMGGPMFTNKQIQHRRRIWWGCMFIDRYVSITLGRPVYIRAPDFDVPLPDIPQDDHVVPDECPSDDAGAPRHPSHTISTFVATSSLSMIQGSIVSQIYSVRHISSSVRQAAYVELERELDQWYLNLPSELKYQAPYQYNGLLPNAVYLNINYWGTVLLLNRAFIPLGKGTDANSSKSAIQQKAWDLAQAAANHISMLITLYRENFSLNYGTPFIENPLMAAGIMHIFTLRHRPADVQASTGLKRILIALKELAMVWPSANTGWDLLSGAGTFHDENIFIPKAGSNATC